MKRLLFNILLLLCFTCQAQLKLMPLPAPVSINIDTMSCSKWFDMYHRVNGDIDFIRLKGNSAEILVHHYRIGLRYITFSKYLKEDWNEKVIVRRYNYKINRNLLVKI